MKNGILYALALLVISVSAQAAPQTSAARALSPERKAVIAARVKLMNDARKLGPSAPQVQADKEALIRALGNLNGTGQNSRPVNVKRNPKQSPAKKHARSGKRTRPGKRTMAAKLRRHRKLSHRANRKHARVA